jgi:integrase
MFGRSVPDCKWTDARLGNVHPGEIDSKLRGCDVVALRVEDFAPSGFAVDRATMRQKKTGRPVRFELTEQTRQAVDDYIKVAGKKRANFCSVAVVITTAA